MKQMKHWTMGLALLAGSLTMTSCLGGDSDPYEYNNYLAKVGSSMFGTTFSSVGNQVITIPEEGSVVAYESTTGYKFSNMIGQVGLLYTYWDPEVVDIPADETRITGVSLNTFLPLDSPVRVMAGTTPGAEADTVAATHPIISLNPYAGMDYTPFFFDNGKQEIVAYVNYYVPTNNSGVTSYDTKLVYYPDDPATKDAQQRDTLCLYLNYVVKSTSDFNNSSYQSINQIQDPRFYTKTFRLSADDVTSNSYNDNILQIWRIRTGKSTPEGVKIVVKENISSLDLDNSMTKQVSYPVRTWQEAAGVETAKL